MTDSEILALAYQQRRAGDARPLSEIVAEIRADAAALAPPPPGPDDVVGMGEMVLPDGTVERWQVLGDGRRVDLP